VQGAPPLALGVAIDLMLVCVAGPQLAEQSDHGPKGPHTQSTGQTQDDTWESEPLHPTVIGLIGTNVLVCVCNPVVQLQEPEAAQELH